MNLRFPVLPAILVVSVLPLDVAWRRSRQSVIGLGIAYSRSRDGSGMSDLGVPSGHFGF